MKKLTLLLATFTVLSCNHVSAQDADLNTDIKELLILTGSGDLGVQVMNQMINSYKVNLPEVPAEYWDEFSKKVSADDLIELVIPIYAKYYSKEEIAELVAFYKSAIGKKTIENMPMIMQESMLAGQQWGAKLGEQMIQDLQSEGYLAE